jgi:hypothetical protein
MVRTFLEAENAGSIRFWPNTALISSSGRFINQAAFNPRASAPEKP